MMYSILRTLLFILPPEWSRTIALKGLRLAHRLGLSKFLSSPISKPCKLMGLTFANRVGLAAGLDKNAEYVDALGSLGFGFIEVGTITPKAQIGNPTPRLFRLTKEEALINRLGFNNKGVDYMADQLSKTTYRGILGINIGKNKDTPLDQSVDDYLICFRKLWNYASYITINISSPNTPGLRDLQQSEHLQKLLSALKQEQNLVLQSHQKYVPLVVKISPDLSSDEIKTLAQTLIEFNIDGVIATNTTLTRTGVQQEPYAKETGGLSGKPLQFRSTQVVKELHEILQNKIPIIAAGGIHDKPSAIEKFKAGARLLQVYTGFIYKGPALVKEICDLSPNETHSL